MFIFKLEIRIIDVVSFDQKHEAFDNDTNCDTQIIRQHLSVINNYSEFQYSEI